LPITENLLIFGDDVKESKMMTHGVNTSAYIGLYDSVVFLTAKVCLSRKNMPR